MFIDDIKATREIYQKIIDGKRLTGSEKKQLDDLKNKYGINENGTVKSQSDLAELMGVTRRTIIRWKQEGMPVDQDGNYDPIKIMAWKNDLFDDEQDGETVISEKSKWDIEFRKYKALLAEAAYKKEISELVPKDIIENLLVDRAVELKKSLLSRGRRLAMKLANKDAGECQTIIEADILETLKIYSRPSQIIEKQKEVSTNGQE